MTRTYKEEKGFRQVQEVDEAIYRVSILWHKSYNPHSFQCSLANRWRSSHPRTTFRLSSKFTICNIL